jgi:hypothetical protein
MGTMMKGDKDRLILRVAPERKEWLQKRAEANTRSVNAEINHILKMTMAAEQKGAA